MDVITKQRVLISGRNSIMIETLYAELGDSFALCSCGTDKSELRRAATEFRPDLILVCLGGESAKELEAYAGLRDVNATYDRPFLGIGSDADKERLNKALDGKSVFAVNSSFTALSLRNRIQDVIFNCDASDIDVFTAKELVVEYIDPKSGKLGLRKPQILILDDELKFLRVVKSSLTPKYSVTAVSDVAALLERLSRGILPDIILLAYTLGEQLTAPSAVKAIKAVYNVSVLVMVKMNDPLDIEKTFTEEPDGYFVKPVVLRDRLNDELFARFERKIITILKGGSGRLLAKLPD